MLKHIVSFLVGAVVMLLVVVVYVNVFVHSAPETVYQRVFLSEETSVSVSLPESYTLAVEEGYEGMYSAIGKVFRETEHGILAYAGVDIRIFAPRTYTSTGMTVETLDDLVENCNIGNVDQYYDLQEGTRFGSVSLEAYTDQGGIFYGIIPSENTTQGIPYCLSVKQSTYGNGVQEGIDFYADIVESLDL